MPRVRLNEVTVGSTNVDRSEAFYRVLGLTLIVKNEQYLRFECPDGEGTFSVELGEEVCDEGQVTVYFESDKLDSEYERLRRAGIEFEQPPTDMPWLWREARLRDPDGHRLCLFYAGRNRRHPPWRLPSDS
jgi:catechol 2,3-dioxygenase-like lactoylglutathione lyase family enzyme